MKNIWLLLRLLPNFPNRIAKIALINILYGAIIASVPLALKLVLDQISQVIGGSGDTSIVILLVGILVGLRLAEVIVDYVGERTSDSFFLDTATDLREKVFGHLLRLSIDFYEARRIGEIIQRIGGGVRELAQWTVRLFEGMLSTLISLGFMLVLLWILVPPVGLIMSVVFPLNLYLARSLARRVTPKRRLWLSHGEQAHAELTETLTHISTVRSFGREAYKAQHYNQHNADFKQVRAEVLSMERAMNVTRGLINTAAVGVSFFIIIHGVIHGIYSVGDIVLVSLYLQRLISNIVPLSRLISDTAEVDTTCERLNEILENKEIVQDKPDAKNLVELNSLEFKNVSFVYPAKKKEVLKNISFRISKGETLALVGPSGVGKTTITKLLLRFYDVTSGEILINNEPINHFTQLSIRKQMGVVMQDVALFNDTIQENIRFAEPNASNARVQTAAIAAHIDVFVEKLPEKYMTLVGERGIKLSGGEKQRVAIARALLRDPQFIILDEATSALDSESEHYVQDGLRSLLKDKTAIIIAHRLSTVMRADKIIVLKDGIIHEVGNHRDLIKKKGLYAKFFSMQSDSLRDFDLTLEPIAE